MENREMREDEVCCSERKGALARLGMGVLAALVCLARALWGATGAMLLPAARYVVPLHTPTLP